MKKVLHIGLIIILMLSSTTNIVSASQEDLHRDLIPLPITFDVSEGHFTLKQEASIYVQGDESETTDELFGIGEYLALKLRPSTGYKLPVIKGTSVENGNISIVMNSNHHHLEEEGYEILTTKEAVIINVYQPAGAFRAIQTLRQLLPDWIEKQTIVNNISWDIPCSIVKDKPEYSYRGIMLDVSRHFFTVEQVKRQIDLAAQYKINKVHMHLSDDQGWRLEIKGEMYGEDLSKLKTIGASTSSSINGVQAGQYTQEEFKEIVQYASKRYIEIIPEFDMPSHSWAALVSLNFLNSTEDGKPYANHYDNTKPYTGVDVGFSTFECRNEKTYEFIDEVFKQVSAISPSPYLHIGGDEAHVTSDEDYKYFCNRVTQIAQKYGKTAIGWQRYDEVVEDKENTLTQFWSTGNEKLRPGINYIVSPADRAYMDMIYDKNSKFGLSWAGPNPIDDSYTWDPTDYGPKDQIIGIEAALWTETIPSSYGLDYMIYPRLLGHAEIGWTSNEMRDWNEYKTRLKAHGQRLTYQNVEYRKDKMIWKKSKIMSYVIPFMVAIIFIVGYVYKKKIEARSSL